MAGTNKRLNYIDMAKGIGIILVVLGHIVYTEPHVMVWISSFHMPLFFVIAGVMMAIKDREITDVKAEIIHRARGIVIPYLWFSALYFVLDIGNVALGKIDIHTFKVNLISSLTFYGKSVLWFLTALFLAEVYFILLRSRMNQYVVMLSILVITLVSYFLRMGLFGIYEANADSLLVTSLINFLRTFVRAGIVLPFLGFSYYIWKELADKGINEVNKTYKKRCCFLATGVVLILIGIVLSMINGSVDTNNMIMSNPIFYYLGGFAGSFGMIFTCMGLPDIKVLSYLGRNSLVIMATHLDCYILWAGLTISMRVYGIIPSAGVLVVLATIITLLITTIPVYIINRFMPFVLGRPFKGRRS